MKEAKATGDCLENVDPEVHQAVRVPLVLRVLVLKETRDTKGQQVHQDHPVARVTLVQRGGRVKTDHQAPVDQKAAWEKLVSLDLSV